MPTRARFQVSILILILFAHLAQADSKKTDQSSLAEYHFSLAEAYSADELVDRSIEEYKLALNYDPNSALIYTRLAAEYVKKGLFSLAMESCKKALQRSRDSRNNLDALLLLAGLYAITHDFAKAIEQYGRVLKIDSHHEEAAINKSELLIESGRYKEGIDGLNDFLKKNPRSAFVWYHLARAYHQSGNYDKAIATYRKAMTVRPGFNQAVLGLGFLYEETQKDTAAIATYRKLFDETQDSIAAERLSAILLRLKKYREAIPFLLQLEANDPDDLNIKTKLGLLYMETKDNDKAIAIFRVILAKNPNLDKIHYYLGSIYEGNGQIQEAVIELSLVQPGFKLYKDVILHTAFLMEKLQEDSRAKGYLKKAIETEPRVPEFYLFLAYLEEQSENLSEAIAIMESASQKFAEDEKIHYYLGTLYDRSGHVEKSLKEMETIVSINPKHVDALNYLGYTWTTRGIRLTDAEKVLRRAVKLSPANPYVKDSWGWYLFTTGRTKEAVVELEKAALLKPEEATILEHLGDAYLRSNLRQKAFDQYLNAKKNASSEEAKKKIQLKMDILRQDPTQTQNRTR